MVSEEPVTVEGLQTSNVRNSMIPDNYGSSIHTGRHPSAFSPNITSSQEGQTSLPVPDVLLWLYHGVPV